jgi:hypothetical protein
MLYSAFSKVHTKAGVVNRRTSLVAALSLYPVLALGFVGMIWAASRNKASLLLHAVIVANLLTYAPMLAVTRFRLPMDAYWIAFASFALVAVCERLARRFSEARARSAVASTPAYETSSWPVSLPCGYGVGRHAYAPATETQLGAYPRPTRLVRVRSPVGTRSTRRDTSAGARSPPARAGPRVRCRW